MSKVKSKFLRMYLKYIVKSSKCFWAYLGIFTVLFLYMTCCIQLEERKEYQAFAYKDEIVLTKIAEINAIVHKIYVYTDKNEQVENFSVTTVGLMDGELHLYLQKPQEIFAGSVTAEIIVGKSSLFSSILKGGR
ncbi:MAG: hypothetical protein IKC46_04365 [Lachnospiraceae bacterium]|nr:hypothetical protein [Lachnospiraceae bacterium]